MPRAYVPRNASESVCAAAADAPDVLVWFIVAGGAGPARGRESVAMMTPDETTAKATFAKEQPKRKGKKRMLSARVGGWSRWRRGERGGKGRYVLFVGACIACP